MDRRQLIIPDSFLFCTSRAIVVGSSCLTMAGAFDVKSCLARLSEEERAKLESEDFKQSAEAAFDKADVSQTGDLLDAEMFAAVQLALPEERKGQPCLMKKQFLDFFWPPNQGPRDLWNRDFGMSWTLNS